MALYLRPTTLDEALAALADTKLASNSGTAGSLTVLAGGTDFYPARTARAAWLQPPPHNVLDISAIEELKGIRQDAGGVSFGALATWSDIRNSDLPPACDGLKLAAREVGGIQVQNRGTLAGNICNASPAADTAPALLVHGAIVVVAGPAGARRIPIDGLFVRSGVTTLGRGELVTAIELPVPDRRLASVHLRRTRRRGHDLASVTLCCGIDETGVTRLAYGSVGPRPILSVDTTGVLADPAGAPDAKAELLERMFAAASPSARSMRASPTYRLAMLRVLGRRGVQLAVDRLAAGQSGR
jgi:N-methylhydantoinase B